MAGRIAIIGMACRLPGGVDSVEGFWELLREGRDVVQDEPPARFDVDPLYHPDPRRRRLYTRAGGFLNQVEDFDASFFGISPREAAQIDPQQRLVLEMAWEALENAGVVATELAGSRAGVFIGVSSTDNRYTKYRDDASGNAYTNAGNALSIVANRVSYALDLHGPSMAIDTACSSSLVAVHEACRSLCSEESSVALAGGVNVLLDPKISEGFCRASMLSPSGRCHAFGAAADGYVRSEGGGVVVLKRLEDALRDGDPIRAVIAASAVNSDGRTQGLALPSAESQVELLRSVYSSAGVEPRRLVYVEAHGTGTPAGDPIECEALGQVLGEGRSEPLPIGSVKTNVGHLEPASGIAGLIKAVLCLQHRWLPASLHCSTLNPAVPWDRLNLEVVREGRALSRDGALAVGVNSFGFGGANAHAVLEEWPHPITFESNGEGGRNPLLFSAKSPEALRELAGRYADLLDDPHAPALGDLAHAAAKRRVQHRHRAAILADDAAETREALRMFSDGERSPLASIGRAEEEGALTAFVFSGNGSQWPGMARRLLRRDGGFTEALHRVSARLVPMLGWSVIDELLAGSTRVGATEVAQPLLFAIQVALVDSLRASGLEPDAVAGHSVGEISAAYACGALSLDDACHVIVERSRAQAGTAGKGTMAAVGLPAADVQEELSRLDGAVSIAGINSPRSVTLAGPAELLDGLGERLEGRGVFYRRLDINYPFHTSFMNPFREDLYDALADLSPRASRLPFVSSVTGSELPGDRLDHRYWWDNIRQPVRFGEAVQTLVDLGVRIFLELGPHPVLRSYVRECMEADGRTASFVASLSRDDDDALAERRVLGACHTAGSRIDLDRLFPGRAPWVPLPTYPWQRERHWDLDPPRRHHPLLGRRTQSGAASWRCYVDSTWPAYLADHKIQSSVILPAAGYAELALAAAEELGWSDRAVEGLEIRRPVVFSDEAGRYIEVRVSEADGSFEVRSRAASDTESVLHATGDLAASAPISKEPVDLDTLRDAAGCRVDHADHYARYAARGLDFDESFRGVGELWVGRNQVLARLAIPDSVYRDLDSHRLHPALLDACIQSVMGLLDADGASERDSGTNTYLPVAIGSMRIAPDFDPVACAYVRCTRRPSRGLHVDYVIVDSDGNPLVELRDVRFRQLQRLDRDGPKVYRWKPRLLEGPPAPLEDIVDVERLLASAKARFDHPAAQRRRDRFYGTVRRDINALILTYSHAALAEIWGAGPIPDLERLVVAGEIEETQQRYLEYLVDLLERNGRARRSDGTLRLEDGPDLEATDRLWRELVGKHPDYFPELEMIARCGRALPAILRGESDALQVVFPVDSMGLIEQLFESSSSFRTYNEAASALMGQLGGSWPTGSKLRVLEVGGGTGGFTTAVLSHLPSDRTDYLFTDVGHFFVDRAARRFQDFPFVRCGVFDVERGPSEQEIEPGTFDVVVAANVLHATTDLRQTLRNVRRALVPGGLLLLLESQADGYLDFVFGLLRGWWLFTDSDLRQGSPLLAPAAWERVLTKEGFDSVSIVHEETDGQTPSHALIVAREPSAKVPGDVARQPALDERRTWLVFTDAEENVVDSKELARHIVGPEDSWIEVEPGDSFARIGPTHFVLPPADPQAFERLIATLREDGVAVSDVLHLWGLSRPGGDAPPEPLAHQELRSLSVGLLAQSFIKGAVDSLPRLWVLTSNAFDLPGRDVGVDPFQAPVWGIVRTLLNEEARFPCRLIDVEGATETARQIAAEVSRLDAETEVFLHAGGRYANRLQEVAQVGRSEEADAYRLELPSFGRAATLPPRPMDRRPPGAEEVEIEVRAAGVNFRDVLLAAGVLPPEALEEGGLGNQLGLEVAGEVVRVGSDAGAHRPGDAVFGFAPGGLASHVVAHRDGLWKMGDDLGFEEAATLPIAFTTVYYALHLLARLQAGERLLVHGAAGGVGLAAIQFAASVGAEVFATAGTPEKHAFLRRLGVRHVFDSRSLAFADGVRRATNGEGVDVVLNSLEGRAIEQGLSLLRSGGRFVELGKRDIFSDRKLGLRAFANNVSFHGVDLEALHRHQKSLLSDLVREMSEAFRAGTFQPLPYRVFDVTRASEAFRFMQSGKHIGKVVVDFSRARPSLRKTKKAQLELSPDATYLVTGGLGGFGLATAGWMIERGARHLVLVGRSGDSRPEAKRALAGLRGLGADVKVIAADVTDRAQVRDLIAGVGPDAPLRGVVHAALVLDDVSLLHMDAEKWNTALRPKLLGASNLDRETRSLDLDFFVLYSSVAAAVGNPGQANYAAANLFLDSLAEARQGEGLPGTSVAWGAVSDVGYLAENPELRERLEERFGMVPMEAALALAYLEQLLTQEEPPATACVCEVHWPRLRRATPRSSSPLFEEIGGSDLAASSDEAVELLELNALAALPRNEAIEVVVEHLARLVAAVLRIPPEDLDLRASLVDLGADSLMMLELEALLDSHLDVQLPSLELADAGGVRDLAERLVAMTRRAPGEDESEADDADSE